MTGKHFNRKFVNEIIGTLKKNGFECTPHKKNKNKYRIGKNNEIIKIPGLKLNLRPIVQNILRLSK